MGMMFPVGLARIEPAHVPLAWAVNGCFSVIGVALAGVLAMDFGFSVVIIAAAVLYAVALAVWPKLRC
jgi:hypothetical protein